MRNTTDLSHSIIKSSKIEYPIFANLQFQQVCPLRRPQNLSINNIEEMDKNVRSKNHSLGPFNHIIKKIIDSFFKVPCITYIGYPAQ